MQTDFLGKKMEKSMLCWCEQDKIRAKRDKTEKWRYYISSRDLSA